jgi:hypothetical protein
MRCFRGLLLGIVVAVLASALGLSAAGQDQGKGKDKDKLAKDKAGRDGVIPEGFTVLFNGKDLDAWRLPRDDKNHWKLLKEGLLDYDGLSQAKGEKHLWSRKPFRDFVLVVDWRLKNEPGFLQRVPLLAPDGQIKKDAQGRERTVEIDDVRAGVLLRGRERNRINIGKWPVGSGQVGPARPEPGTPPEVRAACTPKEKADNPPGEWNTFEITVKGDRVAVKLNGKEVIADAPLPESHREGPIGLEHDGTYDAARRRWKSAPSLVQFRNIAVKELK